MAVEKEFVGSKFDGQNTLKLKRRPRPCVSVGSECGLVPPMVSMTPLGDETSVPEFLFTLQEKKLTLPEFSLKLPLSFSR